MAENKQELLCSYIWKGPKTAEGEQSEIRLMDCDFDQLQRYYQHCQQMLYNDSPKIRGRLTLIKDTEKQIQNCRAELLVRWLRLNKHYTYQDCYDDIRALIAKNKDTLTQEVVETYPISHIMAAIPDDYKRVPVGAVLKASMYALGVLDVSHITLNFLIKLGIYLTAKEMQQDLFERDPDTGKARNRMEIIKQRENLNPSIRLECRPDGLSYAEFHQMCRLKTDKYEHFTSAQLEILSKKVLYRFQLRCEEQAKRWQEISDQILEVAEYKGWDVTREIK